MSSAHLTQLRKWFIHSPPGEWVIQRIRELLIGALRQGPIPQHIAFVMDGNRRYARTNKIETVEGHHLGFEALARILEVCYKSGVRVVTIYAFSIENFKRSKYEVDALMDMAKVKLTQLAQHGELLQRYQAKIQILGDHELVRPDVLEAINKAVDMTKSHDQAVLNVCFPYTSRNEITTAVRETVREFSQPLRPISRRTFSESHITRNIRSRQLDTVSEDSDERMNPYGPLAEDTPVTDEDETEESTYSAASTNDRASSSQTSTSTSPARVPQKSDSSIYPDPESITVDTLTHHTFTADAPPLDLLVRTSGVHRLSDFMLWQAHENTAIVFLECLWPAFDLWQFLPVLVEWQWNQRKAEELQTANAQGLRRQKTQ